MPVRSSHFVHHASRGRNGPSSRMPCSRYWLVRFFLAAFTYIGLPAMLRIVKVVVAYFKEYRVKYGRFMKRNFMLGAWAVGAAALTVRGWIYFGSRSVHYSRCGVVSEFLKIYPLPSLGKRLLLDDPSPPMARCSSMATNTCWIMNTLAGGNLRTVYD